MILGYKKMIAISVASIAIALYMLPIEQLFSSVQAKNASGGSAGKYGGHFPGKGHTGGVFPGKGHTGGVFPGKGHGVSGGNNGDTATHVNGVRGGNNGGGNNGDTATHVNGVRGGNNGGGKGN
jgi:hypothetical protein